jgi:hypothetical protein
MSEISKTEIGRRFFKMQKEKQVEKAIEKIRQAQGSEWACYSPGDIEALKQVLGEVWIFMERDSWDQVAFTRLSGIELREPIRYGRDVHDSVISGKSAAEKSIPVQVRKDSSFFQPETCMVLNHLLHGKKIYPTLFSFE